MGGLNQEVSTTGRASRGSIKTSLRTDQDAGEPDQVSPTARPERTADVLYLAAAELLTATDASAVFSCAVRNARRLLSTDIAFISLLDPVTNVLRLQASVGHRTPTFTTIVRPVQAITAVGTGRPVQTSDFLNDSRLDHDPPTDDIVRKEGMRTVLGVPLRSGDRTLGALYVGDRYARRFLSTEVAALARLAEHVSAALVHAQALAEVVERLDQTTKRSIESEAERSLLIGAEEVWRAVTAALQEGEAIGAVAVALATCLDRSVMVTDWKMAIVVQAHGKSPASGMRSSNGVLNRPESREAVAACTDTHRPIHAGRDWLVAPIEAGRDLLGYLWIGQPGSGRDAQLVELVMERMAPVVAIELLSRGDIERRLRGDFIYELLSERPPDLSVLEARAAQVWSHYGEAHRPVVLNISAAVEQWGTRLEAARRLVAAARPNDFVTVYGRYLILFVSPSTRRHVDVAISDTRQLLQRNQLSATAVVGGPCRDLRESRESTITALRLHDLLGTTGVLWAEGLEALTQLFDPTQRDRLKALCSTALAPLGRREGLMDALHAYYEAGGNKADAARRLSVHVNTLRQRLVRVEELIGGSVNDSIRSVPLRLALLVRDVLSDQ